jgi:hypothetical protein
MDSVSAQSKKLKKEIYFTVLFDSISSFNYTDINAIFLTGDDENSFTVQTFRYEMQNCLPSVTTEDNVLQRC